MSIADRLSALAGRVAAFAAAPLIEVARSAQRPMQVTRAPAAVRERLYNRDALFGVTTYTAGTIPSWISTYPMTELTPQKIASIQRMVLTTGWMVDKACLDEDMVGQDTHLSAVDFAVRNAVTSKPLTFEAADESDLAQQVAAYTTAMIDGCDGFASAMFELLYGDLAGYSLQEVVYRPDAPVHFNGQTIVGDHPREFSIISNKITRFEVTRDELMVDFGQGQHEPPPEHKFLTYYAPGNFHKRRRGANWQIVWPCMVKNNAIMRMAAVLEVWGLQMPHGIIDEDGWQNETKRAEYLKVVQSIGLMKGAVYAGDMKIEPSPTPANLDIRGMHLAIIDWCNAEISKRRQGSTLTTQLSGTGSYNAAAEHAGVKETFVAMTERALSETVRRWLRACYRLNARALEQAFNAPIARILQVAPRPYWRIDREMTPLDRMKVLDDAVNVLGLTVDEDQAYKEFGLQRARSMKTAIRGKAVAVSEGATLQAPQDLGTPSAAPPRGEAGTGNGEP